MCYRMKLLVVEDDNDMFESYEDTALDYSPDIDIDLVRETSSEDALSKLLSNDFDGAIVDLNLSQSSPSEASGNEVLKEIVNNLRFPVYVVSGNLGNLEEDLQDKESKFFKFFNRDVSNDVIFSGLVGVYKTGMTKIFGGRGEIEKNLSHIFWNHLAKDFAVWESSGKSMERTLLRYIVSHLAEYLDIPEGEDHFYHEAEFYIKPPIRKYVASGDVFEIQGDRYLNLSPACDVAVRGFEDGKPVINARSIVAIPLIKISREEFIDKGLVSSEDNARKRKSVIEDVIKGRREKYVFLPAYGEMYASVLDFQNIKSLSLEEVLNSERIATVANTFLKDIQSRFSAYYGRQGQPDLNKKSLIEMHKGDLSDG